MNNENFTERFKKIDFKKAIYPVISTVFFATIFITFFYSAKLLLVDINKVFFDINKDPSSLQIIEVNLDQYNLIAKKMNLNVQNREDYREQLQPEIKNEIATSTPSIPENVLDKKSIKIEILNSTKTKGLAAELKILLENRGFIVTKIGNQPLIEKITVIKIKDAINQSSIYGELLDIISQKYPSTTNQLLEDANEFDAIITIGNN